MKKKHYQSPRLKVREYKMKHQMLSASNESYGVTSTSYSDSDFEEN